MVCCQGKAPAGSEEICDDGLVEIDGATLRVTRAGRRFVLPVCWALAWGLTPQQARSGA